MKASDITLDIDDGVGIIALNAPERRNALTVEMANAIIGACDEIDARDDIRSVVVRAEGPAFCAGADRALLLAAAVERSAKAAADLDVIYRSFGRVRSLSVPTIAAVRGRAVGAGLNLALAADLRILAADASLVSGFSALGLHPGGGHIAAVARNGGPQTAAAMTLFGQAVDAERACRVGLAWEVVASEQVDARAIAIGRAAADDVELARAVKASLRTELGPPALAMAEATSFEAARQWWSIGRERTRDRLTAVAKGTRSSR